MINVMYLVLTAMLALNVSNEILNAFKTVKRSLEHSSDAIELKNAQIFKSFKDKLNEPENAENAKIWFPKAEEAKKLADDAYNYIEALKNELILESGQKTLADTGSYKADDLDAATRLFVEQKKKGPELLKKLQDFKAKLLGIDTSIMAEFGKTLPIDLSVPVTQNKELNKWEEAYFHMTPSIAALTILSKFQNDIRNSEAQVVEFCHKKVGEVKIKYDKFEVIASTSSSYLMPGEEASVYAGLASYSSTATPTITVDGSTATPKEPGAPAEVKFKADGAPGERSKTVVVTYKNPNTGKDERVERIIKYTVGAPAGLAISTDKTRVLYVGLDNPLTVTGSGGAEQLDVQVQGQGASISNKGGGNYIVNVTTPGKASILATDKKNNKTTTIEVPVKRVPLPLATIGGIASGSMPVNKFKAQGGIIADLKDFVFEGVKYNVVSYFIMFTGSGFPEPYTEEVTGAGFTSRTRSSAFPNCQDGTTVIIGNIKVEGPGGSRTLDQGITLILE
jgi:gliding motility-associated protein GldM